MRENRPRKPPGEQPGASRGSPIPRASPPRRGRSGAVGRGPSPGAPRQTTSQMQAAGPVRAGGIPASSRRRTWPTTAAARTSRGSRTSNRTSRGSTPATGARASGNAQDRDPSGGESCKPDGDYASADPEVLRGDLEGAEAATTAAAAVDQALFSENECGVPTGSGRMSSVASQRGFPPQINTRMHTDQGGQAGAIC